MSWTVLRVSPDPARLGVVRMALVAFARSQQLDESLLEDIKLAVTEAAGRAISAHRARGIEEPVDIEMHISEHEALVMVNDSSPGASGEETAEGDDASDDGGADGPRVPEQLALVAGIADELEVRHGMDGTHVTMRWSRGEVR